MHQGRAALRLATMWRSFPVQPNASVTHRRWPSDISPGVPTNDKRLANVQNASLKLRRVSQHPRRNKTQNQYLSKRRSVLLCRSGGHLNIESNEDVPPWPPQPGPAPANFVTKAGQFRYECSVCADWLSGRGGNKPGGQADVAGSPDKL